MKKLSAPCLFALLLGCFSQTTTMTDIDSLFEKSCINGVILETELSKYEFDTSESVILTGFARNCSETDSVFFTVVPTGANYNVKFNLRNFINFDSYDFMDFDLLTAENAAVVKPSMKTIQRKLAPGEKVEVFSFDLKKLQNLPCDSFRRVSQTHHKFTSTSGKAFMNLLGASFWAAQFQSQFFLK